MSQYTKLSWRKFNFLDKLLLVTILGKFVHIQNGTKSLTCHWFVTNHERIFGHSNVLEIQSWNTWSCLNFSGFKALLLFRIENPGVRNMACLVSQWFKSPVSHYSAAYWKGSGMAYNLEAVSSQPVHLKWSNGNITVKVRGSKQLWTRWIWHSSILLVFLELDYFNDIWETEKVPSAPDMPLHTPVSTSSNNL
jgi:hypothetical protein